MRFLLAVLLLASAIARAESEIDPNPAIGGPSVVTLSGRVLADAVKPGSALSTNLQRLTAKRVAGGKVQLAFEGLSAETLTDDDGFFEVTFSAPKGHPFLAGLRTATVQAAGQTAVQPVTILAEGAPFLVISDFDDTIAVTNVLHKKELVSAALLQDGTTQPPVGGMAPFYRCLADHPEKPGFALVSGSPQQYVPRTITFLSKNLFPFMGVYLRDLGPATLSAYKEPVIRRILLTFPTLPVIAIGDSGEHDPEVYARIRREFPGRIARVYIHDVGHDEDPSRFDGMLLFKDPAEAARDAVKQGFAAAACVEKAFPPTR